MYEFIISIFCMFPRVMFPGVFSKPRHRSRTPRHHLWAKDFEGSLLKYFHKFPKMISASAAQSSAAAAASAVANLDAAAVYALRLTLGPLLMHVPEATLEESCMIKVKTLSADQQRVLLNLTFDAAVASSSFVVNIPPPVGGPVLTSSSGSPTSVNNKKRKATTCQTCGGLDHNRVSCTVKCSLCEEPGHQSKMCTNLCKSCKAPGHNYRQCPVAKEKAKTVEVIDVDAEEEQPPKRAKTSAPAVSVGAPPLEIPAAAEDDTTPAASAAAPLAPLAPLPATAETADAVDAFEAMIANITVGGEMNMDNTFNRAATMSAVFSHVSSGSPTPIITSCPTPERSPCGSPIPLDYGEEDDDE